MLARRFAFDCNVCLSQHFLSLSSNFTSQMRKSMIDITYTCTTNNEYVEISTAGFFINS